MLESEISLPVQILIGKYCKFYAFVLQKHVPIWKSPVLLLLFFSEKRYVTVVLCYRSDVYDLYHNAERKMDRKEIEV